MFVLRLGIRDGRRAGARAAAQVADDAGGLVGCDEGGAAVLQDQAVERVEERFHGVEAAAVLGGEFDRNNRVARAAPLPKCPHMVPK